MATHELEIQSDVNLCDSQGNLNPAAVGWSRQPLHRCNLTGRWGRKKRWNYWCITTPDFLFSLTLSHLDYLGLAFIYYLDFSSGNFMEQTVSRLLGRGCDLPEGVPGEIRFDDPAMQLIMADWGDQVTLQADSPSFGGRKLHAEFQIERPAGHETLNVVIPWSRRLFQFTSKQNTLPARGKVELDGIIQETGGNAFACLDFGHGIWKYSCFWNWASFSTRLDGRTIGVNLGGRWTDGTGMTENGICVDGRLSKIGSDLIFEYDSSNFKRPWIIYTPQSEQIQLTFAPFFERVAKTEVLVLGSEVHQMIGRFNGSLQTDEGETIPIHDVIGWAEDHHARW